MSNKKTLVEIYDEKMGHKTTRPPEIYQLHTKALQTVASYIHETEAMPLREALETIRDLCQTTCMTFEEQSFKATRIAKNALVTYQSTKEEQK